MEEVVSTKKYNPEDKDKILEEVIKLLDNLNVKERIEKPNSKILLLIDYEYHSKAKNVISINPEILVSVMDYFEKISQVNHVNNPESNIFIGVNTNKKIFHNYIKKAELKKSIKPENIIELDSPVKIKFVNGKFMKYFQISEKIYDFDMIVNIAKLKGHPLSIIAGTTNNLLNLIPQKIKYQTQLKLIDKKDFAKFLIDLNELVKPQLNILECPIPNYKKNKNNCTNKSLMLASQNSLLLDKLAQKIISLKKIPILKEYDKSPDYKIVGDFKDINLGKRKVKIEPKIANSFRILNFLSRKLIFAKPKVIKDKCVGCASCVSICPKKCIRIKKNKAEIKYKNCIHCNSCAEYCIKDAIILKSGRLTKLILSIKKIVKF